MDAVRWSVERTLRKRGQLASTAHLIDVALVTVVIEYSERSTVHHGPSSFVDHVFGGRNLTIGYSTDAFYMIGTGKKSVGYSGGLGYIARLRSIDARDFELTLADVGTTRRLVLRTGLEGRSASFVDGLAAAREAFLAQLTMEDQAGCFRDYGVALERIGDLDAAHSVYVRAAELGNERAARAAPALARRIRSAESAHASEDDQVWRTLLDLIRANEDFDPDRAGIVLREVGTLSEAAKERMGPYLDYLLRALIQEHLGKERPDRADLVRLADEIRPRFKVLIREEHDSLNDVMFLAFRLHDPDGRKFPYFIAQAPAAIAAIGRSGLSAWVENQHGSIVAWHERTG